MSGLEIILLIAGLVIIVASFIFSSKDDASNVEKQAALTNKQKEDMKNQILAVFDEQMEALTDKTENTLDKMATQKMSEMNEYSDSILAEINRNHNEVMFLYDMLNEKKKEVNNTVRDLNVVKKEIVKKVEETEPKSKADAILDQLDAVSETVSDSVSADEIVEKPKPKRKQPAAGKTAAKRARTTVKKETLREENKDPKAFETGNNNEKILELNSQGKSNVEIAKELGLGIGEVKLVIDLFRGGR